MGSKVTNRKQAINVLQSVTSYFTKSIPRKVRLQTMTIIASLPGPVNLYEFHKKIRSQYEFELFSALKITAFGRVCANLFSTGKIVLTGCQSSQQAKDIIEKINNIYYCNDNNDVHKDCAV